MAGIYIHIPFCKKRCIYCDFYSTTDNRLMDTYIDVVCEELQHRIGEIGKENVSTIYIGGGTPSQLSIALLERLIFFLKQNVIFDKIEEFTIEVNPDDVTSDYMKSCKAMGINRVSMGVQSFVDCELEAINRRHTAQQALYAVDVLKKAGFFNISIDLIYGLPMQTLESWQYSIEKAIELDVAHISCYNLSYEEGTLLTKKRDCGEIEECSEEVCVKMYDSLIEKLSEAGYEHYEISNFAKHGKYSRHNSNYWNLTPYLGVGASAHSFDGKVRRYNPASIHDYMEKVKAFGVAYEEENETEWEKFNEYIMINLRTKWGVDERMVEDMFGEEYKLHLIIYSKKFIESGELKYSDGVLTLSEKGIMLSDYVIRELMYLP